MARTRSHFNVRPRYTAGSPAMVSEDIARRVAEEEREDYQRALDGTYGPEAQERARRDGLRPLPSDKDRCFQCEDAYAGHPRDEAELRIVNEISRGMHGPTPLYDHVFDGSLRSIAEEVEEHTNHWLVRDLCTGDLYQRHFDSATLRGREASAKCSRCLAARERAQAEVTP